MDLEKVIEAKDKLLEELENNEKLHQYVTHKMETIENPHLGDFSRVHAYHDLNRTFAHIKSDYCEIITKYYRKLINGDIDADRI